MVIWVVSVGDSVTIAIAELTIVRIVGIGVGSIGFAVTVCVGVVRVGALGVFLSVGEAIVVRIRVTVPTVGWVETVANFPSVWESIAITVSVVHVGSSVLLLGVGESITIPVGPTIGGVKWIGAVTGHHTCAHGEHQGSQNCKHRIFESVCLHGI